LGRSEKWPEKSWETQEESKRGPDRKGRKTDEEMEKGKEEAPRKEGGLRVCQGTLGGDLRSRGGQKSVW